ncbi:hypothetical protein DFQ11_107114 [Winogradskyella epiphytica]|uniref:Tellurite resistance protein TerB n=2 Tax=Winogradskyella epiphytica TaxID=262005 RepID=A0A2V4WU05_9FLAO|nr:hypothetical protein DFQ11_107114 [Winogradskyella epiphytica]
MNTETHKILQFYQNLGKLFYAMSAIDNIVREEECKSVEELVKRHWLKLDFLDDNTKLEAEAAILETFKWLCRDKEYNAEDCYTSFVGFKRANPTFFTNEINSLILKTVGQISASFSGQNKSELILLAKLNIELKNV